MAETEKTFRVQITNFTFGLILSDPMTVYASDHDEAVGQCVIGRPRLSGDPYSYAAKVWSAGNAADFRRYYHQ